MPALQRRSSRTAATMPEGRLLMAGSSRWILRAVEPRVERVHDVREQARAVLELWRVDEDLRWGVELLLTELVTNAVRHARTPFTIILRWDGHLFRGEVTDADPRPLRPRLDASTDGLGGRGLLLVREIATAWGVDVHQHGKTVWFTITRP